MEIYQKTPYIGDMSPGGKYVAKDLYDVGGVPVVIKSLLDGGFINGDCITATGNTIAENHKQLLYQKIKMSFILVTNLLVNIVLS